MGGMVKWGVWGGVDLGKLGPVEPQEGSARERKAVPGAAQDAP